MLTTDFEPATAPAGKLYIDGAWVDAAERYSRQDPARPDRTTGTYAAADLSDVERAYDAAARAGDGWAAVPAPARASLLMRAADILERRLEEAALRMVADIGKPIRDARAEALRATAVLRYHAGDAVQPDGETYPSSDPGVLLMTRSEPVGVVCAITPWNFPLAIPAWKLAPAIGLGNTVVWKPAEAASGSAVLLTEVFEEAGLPPGVLNLVTGSGARLSDALVGDRRLSALTFTGSVEVGDRIRVAAAQHRVNVQLELGGKNPALVLADADLDRAAARIVAGAMLSTGQRCTATSRIYVEEAVRDELVELVLAHTAALRVGDPYDEETDLGPVATEQQLRTVAGFLELAGEAPTRVLAGGGWTASLDEGYYVDPTVLADCAAASPLVRDEIFGPVAVVLPIADLDAGIAAANDTPFGLSAAVFTSELRNALEFAQRIRAGQVHVNRETTGAEPHVPFGGMKASSNQQREQGKAARRFFTRGKTIYVNAT